MLRDPQFIFELLKKYFDDFRLIAAKKEYDNLLLILNESEDINEEYYLKTIDIINTNKSILNTLDERYNAVMNAFEKSNDSAQWCIGSESETVKTSYIVDQDGYLSLRLEGNQSNIPIFEQIAVMYEVDLYKLWVPLCNCSKLLKQICKYIPYTLHHIILLICKCIVAKGELVANIGMGIPYGPYRDLVAHAYAADCVYEKNSVVIIGKSIMEYDDIEIPIMHSNYFQNRAELMYMCATIEMLSPNSTKVQCIYVYIV
jgi:hypothetical protein